MFRLVFVLPIAYKLERKIFPNPRIKEPETRIGKRFEALKYSGLENIRISGFEKNERNIAIGIERNKPYLKTNWSK
jgi:hypothetical protein